MTTATLARPAARPPASAPLQWAASLDGTRVGRDGGPDRFRAIVGLVGQGDAAAVSTATREAVETMILAPLRERVAALPAVRRYGLLLVEAQTVQRDLDGVTASLRRSDASREETLALARPGFSAGLAELATEREALLVRQRDATARLSALSSALTTAKAVAARDAAAEKYALNTEAAQALHARRVELAAQLGPRVGALLTSILGLGDAIHGCSVGQHGAEVVGRLDDFAAAAARQGETGE